MGSDLPIKYFKLFTYWLKPNFNFGQLDHSSTVPVWIKKKKKYCTSREDRYHHIRLIINFASLMKSTIGFGFPKPRDLRRIKSNSRKIEKACVKIKSQSRLYIKTFSLPCRSLSPSHLVRELSLSYW